MGKKQRLRKQQKLANKPRGITPPNWFSDGVSPEAQKVMEKLSRINPLTDEALFMNALMSAGSLRDEPELKDFHLPSDEVERAVNRLLPKYGPMLERAQQQSDQELQTTYDELRIEALDIVLTRERRQDFLKRYDALLRRLVQGQDTKKLEQAVIVRMMLDSKDMPWGANALLSSIFEEAKGQVLERFEKAENLILDLIRQDDPEARQDRVLELLQDKERLEELANTLDIPPAMMGQMQEMTEEVLVEFESSLFAGDIELDLFTLEEIEHLIEKINAFAGAEGLEPSAAMSSEVGQRLAQLIAGTLGEIMTEERITQMERDLETIEGEWYAKGITEATLLEIERRDLREIEPSENRFLFSVLLGQIRREGEAPDEDRSKDETQSTTEAVTGISGLHERIGTLFKRPKSE